jgi:hypothetical protein
MSGLHHWALFWAEESSSHPHTLIPKIYYNIIMRNSLTSGPDIVNLESLKCRIVSCIMPRADAIAFSRCGSSRFFFLCECGFHPRKIRIISPFASRWQTSSVHCDPNPTPTLPSHIRSNLETDLSPRCMQISPHRVSSPLAFV